MSGLLITLLVFALIAGLIYYVVTVIPIPQPFKNIVIIILAIIAVLYLIGLLTGHSAMPTFR